MELPDLGLLVDRRTPRPASSSSSTRTTAASASASPHAAERREADAARRASRDAGVDALELSTDDDLVDAILRFADLRKRRSQLADAAAGCRDALAERDAHDASSGPRCCGCCSRCRCWSRSTCWLLRRKKKTALRYASLAPRASEAMGAAQRLRRHVPPAAVPARARRADRSPSRGRRRWSRCRRSTRRSSWRWTCRAACAPTDVAAQPPRRRAGRGQGVRRRAAAQRAHRRRRVRRHRRRGAGADAEPRGHASPRSTASSCSAAPRSAAASSSRWRRCSPTPASTSSQHHRRSADDAARRRTTSRSKDVQAGAAGLVQLGRDHPAHRRPAHHRARPDRGGASMAADRGVRVYTVGIGTRGRRDRSASKAGRCACASTRRRCKASPT